jgi:hypothetical protein
MVQQSCEADMDTCSVHDWIDLANSLSDHPHNVRFRIRADNAKETAVEGGLAIRHQSYCQRDFYTDSVWDEKPYPCGCGYHDRLGNDHLVVVGCLETLPLGEPGTDPVFRVGVAGNVATIKHHMVQPMTSASRS